MLEIAEQHGAQSAGANRLARDYALSGDAAKGRTAYQDVLTLWKDADPDIPS